MTFIPEETLRMMRLAAIPLTGALAGWTAITLATALIFRPRRPVRWLGVTIQGIIPAHREELARAAAGLVARNLPAPAELAGLLERPEVRAAVETAIRERIGDFFDTKLKALNPMFGMMLGGSLRDKVEDLLVRELLRTVPEMMGWLAEKMGENVDIPRKVEEKIRGLDMDELERWFEVEAGGRMRKAALLAGVMGFVIGVVPAVLSGFL